ncbi:MAG: RagB/SusD family nutrient uptake outer membrane protein [Saprospiraceae bacterium]|jgi:starch-binding outer membrane protein, SusD/RagB family|nr:RagB/SusD family nutrient uptake outer membrane protein [Saprospiraceae bacterium]MDP4815232.1 RagB/SusD family nutrient uptake outer membrane protein [Saprospiraceae bacterium]MDP4852255.1 RagB/SusD family nutrient uptake outer membrane protein [Saprospiraceae bacterium]MDP4914843.1 RagB/SusD family nutrient uptake outer membrane protein [Saprospiraceae bacterium]MDP5049243.1 RagB/SusD family nutrient uptake outer membrane protein [Saprospiraceae bacterium]
MKIKNISSAAKRFWLLLFVVGQMGCNEFLTEVAPSNLTPESFYTIPDHAEAAIASVYADLRFMGNGAGIFSTNWQLLEAMTGTSTTETAQNSDLNNLYGLVHDGNTIHIRNYYIGLYRVIAQANQVIDRVPAITPMNAAQKKRILGEAQFLRASAYFTAVQLWGDVPLITKPQTASSEDFSPSRASVESVYKLIVDDLVSAEAAGLPWMDASGRVNSAAIKAQLAKVYLTMAGFPLKKGASHYKLAADKAFEVITYANSNPNVINLFTNYYDVHRENTKNKLEHLFMLQYNASVAQNPMGNFFPNFKPVTFSGPGGTGSSVPTSAFYNSYETGDLRAKNQDGYFYTSYFTNGSGAPFELGAPYVFKHFNQTANGSAGMPGTRNNNLNVPQIRYAEVLLTYAEAQNEVGGPTQAAYDAVKRIRDRAQLTTPALASLSANSFRELVWKERWYELCYEQITWFDMVRLRKAFNENTKGFDEFVGHTNLSSNQKLQQKHLLLPLPIPEMQNNPNLKPQNPGY